MRGGRVGLALDLELELVSARAQHAFEDEVIEEAEETGLRPVFDPESLGDLTNLERLAFFLKQLENDGA